MARLSLFRGSAPTPRILRTVVPIAFVVAMTSSCFITSTPEFNPPPQTPPFLLAQNASPPLGEMVILDPTDQELTLTAPVQSEDADANVSVALYIDYGFQAVGGKPYAFQEFGQDVIASTIGDKSRVASVTWHPSDFALGRPCTRFTLMVSHLFEHDAKSQWCPANLADSSFLTWNVVNCTTSPCPKIDAAVDCAPTSAVPSYCPSIFPPPDMTTSSSTGGAG